MKQLRGEHTFWPWVKTNPSIREIERTLAKEMTRPYPRPRMVRWCRNKITKDEIRKIKILNDI